MLYLHALIALVGISSHIIQLASSASLVPTHDFTQVHSYSEQTTFDERDGWERVSISDFSQKQPNVTSRNDEEVSGVIGNALKAIGEATSVIITWYSGNDLKNPSCWSDSVWTPTDESFICALTLEGWTNRPKCFSFLELCNGPSKCIFVRVVDTCAGCAVGSHHVDLTQSAFSKLANLDTGVLNVNMRAAQLPANVVWNTALWGPKN
ncbi:hypothetical protein DL93DRAFT_2149493 [Clavulina sp. PMI_390]|nr:hypothetical protein DL93DRAFT_2149493 [Clavulina sp. PMI_390]